MSTYWRATMTPWRRRRSVLEPGTSGFARDQHRRRLQDDGAEDLEALLLAASSRSRRRRRRHPRRRAGPRTRPRHPGAPRSPSTPSRVEEVADEPVVARRDPHAGEVLQLGEALGGPGEPERRGAEVELVDLDGRRVRVEQQVAAGDADVERARADVGRDVARAQVEELDVVARVGDDQLLRVAAAGVPGLVQHLDGGLDNVPLFGTAIRNMAVVLRRSERMVGLRSHRCR